jgi:hypothetical protein
MVSFGKKDKTKSKASAISQTTFPKSFFEEAYGFLGGEPEYSPKFVPFAGGPELEEKLTKSRTDRITQAYNDAIARQDEELSQSGLLTSPAKYIQGGARDVLNKNYLNAIQQAATEASLARLETERGEAGRETEFNVDTAGKILQAFLQQLAIAASAGRTSTSTSTSSGGGGFDFGLNLGGKSLFPSAGGSPIT